MRQKGFAPIIIILFVILGVAGYFAFKFFPLFGTSNSRISSNTNPNIKAILLGNIDVDYKNKMASLTSNLSSWDPNFVVTTISIKFAYDYKELKNMYKTGVPAIGAMVWLYSPLNKTSRVYSWPKGVLTEKEKEGDMSRYGNKYQNLSPENHLASSPRDAIEKCMDYSVSQGNYLLYECSNVADDFFDRRGWICTFLDANEAASGKDLWELDMAGNIKSRLCYFDSKTNSVDSWDRLPPIIK